MFPRQNWYYPNHSPASDCPNSDDWRKSLALCLFCGSPTRLLDRGWRVSVSQFGRGDRHCGTLGIYLLFRYTVQQYILQRKSHLCIPFLGIARPQPQFPHTRTCACEPFILSKDRSTCFLQQNIGRRSWEYVKSLTDTWMWKLGLRPRYSFSGNMSSTSITYITIYAITDSTEGVFWDSLNRRTGSD